MSLRSVLRTLQTVRLKLPGWVLILTVWAFLYGFVAIKRAEAASEEESQLMKQRAANVERCKKEGGVPSLNFGWTIVCHDPRAVRWAE